MKITVKITVKRMRALTTGSLHRDLHRDLHRPLRCTRLDAAGISGEPDAARAEPLPARGQA